jgi:hypothetical protein
MIDSSMDGVIRTCYTRAQARTMRDNVESEYH